MAYNTHIKYVLIGFYVVSKAIVSSSFGRVESYMQIFDSTGAGGGCQGKHP